MNSIISKHSLAAMLAIMTALLTIAHAEVEARSTVVGSGEVRPHLYVKVTSDVAGRIREVYVQPGEVVRKGQALVLIEPRLSGRNNVTRYSPLNGVVADIPTRAGETVRGGVVHTTLMTIADMSRIYIEVFLMRQTFPKSQSAIQPR